MKPKFPLLVALIVCSSAVLHSTRAQSADPMRSALAAWTGEYHYVGGDRERDLIEAAIDRATASLNDVMQRAARMRLEESARPYKDIRFEYQGNRMRSWMDGTGPWVSGVTGELSKEKSRDGQRVEVGHHVGPNRLVQVIRTRQGQRTNVYSFSKDKKKLIVDVRIDAEKLPETVRFKLTYERS